MQPSELANLYCYAAESSTIDRLLAEGQTDLVTSMYDTHRYIDDMLGFHPIPWEKFDYGMTHVQINAAPHEAVFLGMKINTSGSFVRLSLQPKGAGWKWKPQRYIQWSSVHTKYTKNFLMKGLAVRAGVITNTMESFKEAITYYAEGLAARGFHSTTLQNSWNSYLQDWKGYPTCRRSFGSGFPSSCAICSGTREPRQQEVLPDPEQGSQSRTVHQGCSFVACTPSTSCCRA